jgi:CBS domain-containing protein
VTAALYVVDDDRRLQGSSASGAWSRRETRRPSSGDIMSDRRHLGRSVTADQEEVADQVEKYDFIAIPVVDANGRLLGAVTFDDVIDVIEEEATEDIYKMAGSSAEEEESRSRSSTSPVTGCRGFWSAWWEPSCRPGAELWPATGSSCTSRCRSSPPPSWPWPATPRCSRRPPPCAVSPSTPSPAPAFRKHILREMIGRAADGSDLRRRCDPVSRSLFRHDPLIGLAFGIAMAIGMSAASLLGAAMPLIARHGRRSIRRSPPGPLVSTINDSLALAVYFGVATMILVTIG